MLTPYLHANDRGGRTLADLAASLGPALVQVLVASGPEVKVLAPRLLDPADMSLVLPGDLLLGVNSCVRARPGGPGRCTA